ncbi:hypothetical protein FRC15_007991 [Serendipita sp. 397]|nr:hypothetical protein FRC15_007991 [Serendipita sp. 397]
MSSPRPRANTLIDLHRPKRVTPTALVIPLKKESRDCLRHLARYEAPHSPPYPNSQSAAVLVALFIGRWGDIYVLLSRRSATLSSYAGDTALPGGRVDRKDSSLEDTARREAFEEIGLPIDRRRVPLLCILPPFLARSHLIVTPVVVLITDPTLRPILNAPEVDTLFSHPLASFLHDRAPFPLPSSSPFLPDTALDDVATTASNTKPTVSTLQFPEQDEKYAGPPPPRINPKEYHTYHDMTWGPTKVRIHSFLTGREASGMKPIAGLTASILLEVATIGYGRRPEGFDMESPGEAGRRERIAWEMNRAQRFIDALKREGIKWDWQKEERRERERREATLAATTTTRPRALTAGVTAANDGKGPSDTHLHRSSKPKSRL